MDAGPSTSSNVRYTQIPQIVIPLQRSTPLVASLGSRALQSNQKRT